MKVIITGGCGFIGHHFVEHVLKETNWDVIVIDKLNYASFGYDRLRDISVFDDSRVHIVNHDFELEAPKGVIKECMDSTYMVHMAAETHVDDSIFDPEPFIKSNVFGTYNAMELATYVGVRKFIYFSTDEVYGPAPEGVFYKECDPVNPTNPYSATKLGGWALVNSFINTYNFPAITTRTMNVIGERQHPQKFVPMCIRKILDDEEIMIHANEDLSKSGTRHYLHARNASSAVLHLLHHGNLGEIYNVVGDVEVSNLAMAKTIAEIMGKPLRYKMVDFHSSRPGHDLRYAMDGDKLRDNGFSYPIRFYESLEKTINWTLDNKEWLYEASSTTSV